MAAAVMPEEEPPAMPEDFIKNPAAWLEDRDHAVQLLAAYLTPGLFSGSLWDPAIERRLNPSVRHVIDVEDLYSPTLFSAPIRRSAGQAIIERADTISKQLAEIRLEVTLWHADLEQVKEALSWADRLVRELASIPHIGPTRASKLAAAKRPELIPIWDSQVSGALGAGRMSWLQYWMAWRNALVSTALEDLRELANEVGHPNLSPLRTIDTIIWMEEWGWKDLPADQWDELREACRSRHTA